MPETVATVEGFTALDRAGLEEFIRTQGLAMDLDDVTLLSGLLPGYRAP